MDPTRTRLQATLIWLAPVVAIIAIAAASFGDESRWLYLVAKPLATILLLAMAWFAPTPVSGRYRTAITLGLFWSLVGDVLLMFPGQFVFGLIAFLIAHLTYLVAFTDGARLLSRPLTWVGCVLLGALMLTVIWSGVPAALQIPVIAYTLALSTMAAQAITRFQVVGAAAPRDAGAVAAARLAAVGGVLFIASDALLAFGRFKGPLPLAALLVLGTYYAAQWFIARSVDRRS